MDWASHVGRLNTACLQHLGQAVTYTPGAGAAVQVQGIFDNAHVRQSGPVKLEIADTQPSVFVRLSDLPSDPEEDLDARFTIAGNTWRASEVRRDGQGGAVCLLKKTG